MGRYGQEIGSDQFGATIMASAATTTDGIQHVILRLSNIEVKIFFVFLNLFTIFLGIQWWSSFSSRSISSSLSYEWKYEFIIY